MSHRFSNPSALRAKIMEAARAPRWETYPQDIRVVILVHIAEVVEQVLGEFE